MTIKKRIACSNIFMIVVPTILIIIFAGILFLPFNNTNHSLEQLLDKEVEKEDLAQRIISNYANQMEYAQDNKSYNNLQSELQEKLYARGYDIAIAFENKVTFSNLTNEDNTAFSSLIHESFMPESFTLESNSICVIRKIFLVNGEKVSITAINPNYVRNNIDLRSSLFAIHSYFAILLILSLIIIVITNGIISSRVAKILITPLELLSYGARQIKEGNLDFEVKYKENDEFGQVCSDFNEMRIRLCESVQTQLQYEEDRKELIAGISHDLRTPLTAIKGYVKGLKDGIANTPEKKAHYHDIIYNKACDMDKLVDNLFIISKLDMGHFPFYFENVDGNDYLQNFVKSVAEDFDRKDLSVTYRNNCTEYVNIRIDSDQMNRVFINILENSAKYKSAGVGEAEISLSCQNDDVIITVKDNGMGVAKEKLPHIFKSFYRGDLSRTNSSESSGLGLSIAERIVKAHGGRIIAENRNGLAIIIKLPAIRGINR